MRKINFKQMMAIRNESRSANEHCRKYGAKHIRHSWESNPIVPSKILPVKRLCIKCLKNQVYCAPNAVQEDKVCDSCRSK